MPPVATEQKALPSAIAGMCNQGCYCYGPRRLSQFPQVQNSLSLATLGKLILVKTALSEAVMGSASLQNCEKAGLGDTWRKRVDGN
jgi:hypothetical protein